MNRTWLSSLGMGFGRPRLRGPRVQELREVLAGGGLGGGGAPQPSADGREGRGGLL